MTHLNEVDSKRLAELQNAPHPLDADDAKELADLVAKKAA